MEKPHNPDKQTAARPPVASSGKHSTASPQPSFSALRLVGWALEDAARAVGRTLWDEVWNHLQKLKRRCSLPPPIGGAVCDQAGSVQATRPLLNRNSRVPALGLISQESQPATPVSPKPGDSPLDKSVAAWALVAGLTLAGSLSPRLLGRDLPHLTVPPRGESHLDPRVTRYGPKAGQAARPAEVRGCPACCCQMKMAAPPAHATRLQRWAYAQEAVRACLRSADQQCRLMCRKWMKEKGLKL